MSTYRSPINIFDYLDYRRFLDGYYRARKAEDAKFSHRFISARVRAGSAGWFADIVQGRTNLSGSHRIGLIALMNLDQHEADYFETLVAFDQAGSTEEKNLQYKRLVSLKGVKPELVGKERFDYYSQWYHSVVRELLFFYDFRGDAAALAKKLQPPISAAEAKKSLKLLQSLGFLQKGASGTLKPTSATLKKDSAHLLHFANFMKANISLAMESLERFSMEERDISTMTLSLSPEAYRKAKEEIRALRERLLSLTDQDDRPDRVYQFNFHAFPVTK